VIKPCSHCGSNEVYWLAKVSGFVECYYSDVEELVEEQNIDKLNWQHRATVYCLQCRRRRRDLRVVEAKLVEVKGEGDEG
jgi:hypothetical protein